MWQPSGQYSLLSILGHPAGNTLSAELSERAAQEELAKRTQTPPLVAAFVFCGPPLMDLFETDLEPT